MSDEKGYQGWKNYETWAVKLWIDNEEPSYRYWSEQAAFVISPEGRHANGPRFPQVATNQAAVFALADQLKEELKEGEGVPDLSGTMYADLLRAALDEVDWDEIAAALIETAEENAK